MLNFWENVAHVLFKENSYCYYPPLPLALPVSAIQRQCLYWLEVGEKVTLRTDHEISSELCAKPELACVLLSRGCFFLLFLPLVYRGFYSYLPNLSHLGLAKIL